MYASLNWIIIGLDNFGVKALSKPMMTSHQSYPKEQISMLNEIEITKMSWKELYFKLYSIICRYFVPGEGV